MVRISNNINAIYKYLLVAICILFTLYYSRVILFSYAFSSVDAYYFGIFKCLFILATLAFIVFIGTKYYMKQVVTLQQQYDSFFVDNPLPMAIADLSTHKFIAANKAAIETYGYSRQEFLNLAVTDIVVDNEPQLKFDYVRTVNRGVSKMGMRRHRKKNGETILVEVSSSRITFRNKNCLLLQSHDVTEIVRAREEKRMAEEERLKQQSFTSYILDNFPVDVAVFNKDHKYILINKTAIKDDAIRKWIIGKDDFDYFKLKGADITKAENRREKFLSAVAGDSKEWVDEYMVNGKPEYVLRKFYPYFQDGDLKYVYGYGMNITQVKRAQIQRDEYLEQLEKIAFATSHKIRQPICNLKGLVEILELEKHKCSQLNDVVDCMLNSISILDNLTTDLAIKLHEYKQNLSNQDNN